LYSNLLSRVITRTSETIQHVDDEHFTHLQAIPLQARLSVSRTSYENQFITLLHPYMWYNEEQFGKDILTLQG
ncbi:MAG TPA: hypothetical protein DDW33_08490, partial [Ktedonobacter sp.]|nr:hypothetical protein [Ktedonobacter sp.]